MTEITDLSTTDAANTSISTESLEGNVANMGRMEETLQAVMGLLARSIRTNVLRFLDHTDDTKKLALDLSGLTTATTRTQKAPDYDGTLASQALGTAIASAGTTDVGAASGSTVHVTGTTTITALGTADAGIERTVIFDDILTLTHNATSLILPGAANITTEAGDTAVFVSEGSGNWRCLGFQKAAARPFGLSGSVVQSKSSSYSGHDAWTSVIPADDTIPQANEGTNIMAVAITPSSTTARLRARFTGFASRNGAGEIAVVIQQDFGNAIHATTSRVVAADNPVLLALEHEWVPGTASEIAVRIRVGPTGEGAIYMNGTTTARRFGGVAACILVVEEIVP